MTTMEYTSELVVMECWCGMPHAIPKSLYDYQRRMHDDDRKEVPVYCPMGHVHVPAAEAKVKRLERKLANTEEELRIERASHTATKGALTKAQRRAARGVCPECHRSFANVARHVAHMHPEALDA